jgi:hypothetical protein
MVDIIAMKTNEPVVFDSLTTVAAVNAWVGILGFWFPRRIRRIQV